MIRLFFALSLFCLVCPMAARAEAVTTKDSVYFTMDDGVESPAEMEEEAQYVYDGCAINAYEASLFDCRCLSGAFLLEREKVGPTVPQQDIIEKLTVSPAAKCANTDAIAGDIYQTCMNTRPITNELATDNEEFCSCLGNKVAVDFAKQPQLSSSLLSQLQINADAFCNDPQNRVKKKVEAPQNPAAPLNKVLPKTGN